MSVEPKRVELTEAEVELARAVHALTFPTHTDCEPRTTDLRDARLHLEALTAAGWVSPEEVTAREAAARREALLEAEEESAKQAKWIEMMRAQKEVLAAKVALAEEDLAAARAAVERLQEWKDSASDVMLGLQDLGRALGLPLGSSITGTLAAKVAQRLKAKVTRIEVLAEEWANDQGILSPDSRYTRNVLLHELRAALAEPERDEEGGRCTELTCPQHGPANRGEGGND